MSSLLGTEPMFMIEIHGLYVAIDRGGPAGCVTAGRLAYADPNLKVMLIEGMFNLRATSVTFI